MIAAHILCFNEQDILGFTLRHYTSFCETVVVHDAFSTDRSRDICEQYGAEVRDWRTDGVNDMLAKKVKADAVMACKADWCIPVDADELIYFPHGAFATLAAYQAAGVAIVKPHGFEMFCDDFPNTEMQIYDQVKMGTPNHWCDKPCLVAPSRIAAIEFGAGAHAAYATLKNGKKWDDEKAFTEPPTYLLHCHHLGGLDRIARRYAGQQSRHSKTNIAKRFGNFEDPRKHAMDKRRMILAGLRQVID